MQRNPAGRGYGFMPKSWKVFRRLPVLSQCIFMMRTELREYMQANEDNKLVLALAYLDNYEEALQSVEDVRRSLLIALIDRKITKYFSKL